MSLFYVTRHHCYLQCYGSTTEFPKLSGYEFIGIIGRKIICRSDHSYELYSLCIDERKIEKLLDNEYIMPNFYKVSPICGLFRIYSQRDSNYTDFSYNIETKVITKFESQQEAQSVWHSSNTCHENGTVILKTYHTDLTKIADNKMIVISGKCYPGFDHYIKCKPGVIEIMDYNDSKTPKWVYPFNEIILEACVVDSFVVITTNNNTHIIDNGVPIDHDTKGIGFFTGYTNQYVLIHYANRYCKIFRDTTGKVVITPVFDKEVSIRWPNGEYFLVHEFYKSAKIYNKQTFELAQDFSMVNYPMNIYKILNELNGSMYTGPLSQKIINNITKLLISVIPLGPLCKMVMSYVTI